MPPHPSASPHRASGAQRGLCTVFVHHTSASLIINENADPKIQLEQAITEAQDQHRRLKEQAANVIASQKQAELRLNAKMTELEKLNATARQALIMASVRPWKAPSKPMISNAPPRCRLPQRRASFTAPSLASAPELARNTRSMQLRPTSRCARSSMGRL